MSYKSTQGFDLVEVTREYFCIICEIFNSIARPNLVACSHCGTEDASILTTSYMEEDTEMDSYMSRKDFGEGD